VRSLSAARSTDRLADDLLLHLGGVVTPLAPAAAADAGRLGIALLDRWPSRGRLVGEAFLDRLAVIRHRVGERGDTQPR